jgi:hypothetical protein
MAAETGKKTMKTTTKSKTAVKTEGGETGNVSAAPAAKKTVRAAAKTKTVDAAATGAPSHAEIAQLAERFWAERGWQDGYAEQDWLRAERELVGVAS